MRFLNHLIVIGLLVGIGNLTAPQWAQAQIEPIKTGLVTLYGYEEILNNRGERKELESFPFYMKGLLAGIEWTLRDQREQGVEQRFCPPDDMVFTVADLHATIQAEVKNNPKYWTPKTENAVGWAAVTGYRRRFPCPAASTGAAPGKQEAIDKFTVGEFNAYYKRLLRIIYAEPRRALGGFSHGFRDGIDGMQFLIPNKICVPIVEPGVYGAIVEAINTELASRREYWADKQDQPVGQAAIIAVKKRYPCGK